MGIDNPAVELRHLVVQGAGATAGNLYAIRAIGICTACRHLTKFNYRLNDNLTITEPGTGNIIQQSLETSIAPKKTSRWFSDD